MPGPQTGTANWDPMTRKSRSRSRSKSGMSRSMEQRRSRSRSNLSRHLSRQRRKSKSNLSSRTSLLNKAAGDVSQWSMGLPSGSRQSRSRSMTQRRSLSARSKPRASSVSTGCKSWNGGSTRRMSQQVGMTKQWDPVSRTYSAKPSGGSGYAFTARNSVNSMDLEMQRSRRNSNSRLPPPNQQAGCCSCKLVIIIITLVAILACALGYILLPDETEEVESDTRVEDDNTLDVAPPPAADVKPLNNSGTIAVSWMITKSKSWGAMVKLTDQQFWSSSPQTGAHQEYVMDNKGIECDGLFKQASSPWVGTPEVAFDERILKKLHSEVDATKSDLCKENLPDTRKAKVKQIFSKWFKSLQKEPKLKNLAIGWKYTFHFRKSEVKKKFHADEEFKFGENIATAHRFMANQPKGGHNPAMLGWIVQFDFVMFDYKGKAIPEGSKRYPIHV